MTGPRSLAAERAAFAALTDRRGVRHQPGLDGLRGLAVAAVVLFHTDLGWLPGGYLGVSLFFTISGAVIGTVILDEIKRHGGFSISRFWARRGRRLLPAAWIVLAVVAVLRVTSTVFSSTTGADVVAAWLQVANWHVIAAHQSYASLFAGPSAVLHFWSLAIEEQFYLVVGVAALLLGRAGGRAAHLLGTAAVGLAIVSFSLPFVFDLGVDRTYYGTDTRAGELLVGLALAAVIASPRRRAAMLRWARPLALAGAAALVAAVLMWRLLDPGTAALSRGLLPVSALVSLILIVGALVPGPVQLLATSRPLRWLGAISYGLYLVHWPVFVALRHADATPGVGAYAVATLVALGLAALSARVVELPVRRQWLTGRPLALGAGTLACVLAVTLVAPAGTTASQDLLERIASAAAAPSTTTTTTVPPSSAAANLAAPPVTAAVAAARPHVALLGDSIAFSLAMTMPFAKAQAQFDWAPGELAIGCGVGPNANRTGLDGVPCTALVDRMVSKVAAREIDAVVVLSCQWELVSQRLPGEAGPRGPGDRVFDAYVLDHYRAVAEQLRAAGASKVLWVRCPRLSSQVRPDDLPVNLAASRDPARVAAINAVIDQLAAEGEIDVLDLASWVDQRVDDAGLRPDGAHFEYDHDTGIAGEVTGLINAALAR